MRKQARRTSEGVSDIIGWNQYIIYHMPRKYGNLNEAIKPVRSDLLSILSFCAKHEPIIYRQSYTYFLDANRINAIRHKTTKSVSNRHFNYLCCLGLLKKVPQYKGRMTRINQNFVEQTKQQHPINTVSILRYTPEKLEEIEQRAILLRKNKITAGNLSCDNLMACGLEELAKEVYPLNIKSSIYRKKKVYENVLEVAHQLCDRDGYTTKTAICEVTGMTKDTLHKLLTVFAQDWKKHFTYHPPNKADKEQYDLITNQWILKEKEKQA